MFKTFEYILGVDSTVPIDSYMARFWRDSLFVHFVGSHSFSWQSPLLSTSVLNDSYVAIANYWERNRRSVLIQNILLLSQVVMNIAL